MQEAILTYNATVPHALLPHHTDRSAAPIVPGPRHRQTVADRLGEPKPAVLVASMSVEIVVVQFDALGVVLVAAPWTLGHKWIEGPDIAAPGLANDPAIERDLVVVGRRPTVGATIARQP